jgi:hypothetical protein
MLKFNSDIKLPPQFPLCYYNEKKEPTDENNCKMDPLKTMLANTNTFKEKESIVFWALLSFVVLFLFIAPFQSHALFNGNIESFETPIYGAGVWTSIFLLILSIYYWGQWRLRNFGDILNIAIWVIKQ